MITSLKRNLGLCAAFIILGACAHSAPKPTLYEQLGGEIGVSSIVKRTLHYSLSDPRIAGTFSESNIPRLEKLITEHLCHLTDGPCEYSGQSMVRAHRGLELNNFHFNAFVENSQKAMDDTGTPFTVQNKLLAILAPMNRDIVSHKTAR